MNSSGKLKYYHLASFVYRIYRYIAYRNFTRFIYPWLSTVKDNSDILLWHVIQLKFYLIIEVNKNRMLAKIFIKPTSVVPVNDQ